MIPWMPLAQNPVFDWSPVLPGWAMTVLVTLVLPLAAVLMSLWYLGQRRMAARGAVLAMLIVRLILLLMIGILFLQPALKWTYTHSSGGTVWLVLDQSPSMAETDPQSTHVERFRWAQGLGYLSGPVRLDYRRAQLTALLGEFQSLSSGAGIDPTEEPQKVKAFSQAFDKWADSITSLTRDVVNDTPAANRSDISTDLKDAANHAHSASETIRRAATLQEAIDDVKKSQSDNVINVLTQAIGVLSQAADNLDAAYLRSHEGDSTVAAAERKVDGPSRSEMAYSYLAGSTEAGNALAKIAEKYHLRFAGFADKAQSLGGVSAAELPDALRSALGSNGQSTDLAAALQLVAAQTSGEPASVIIVSDGQSNAGNDPAAAARELANKNVRVYGLLTGSHEASPDAAVDNVDAPEWVFKGDAINAKAAIRLDGLQGKSVQVDLLRGGQVIQTRQLTAAADKTTDTRVIPFTDMPPEGDRAVEYQVHIRPLPEESNTQNNTQTFRVAVKKDKLYALIIEDRPRWEYRYLSTTWGRDQLLKVQTVLLNPGIIAGVAPPEPVRASPANPKQEAQLLPVTKEEWQAFDIIVLGDVGPDFLNNQAQQCIVSAVQDKGTTLITIAGQYAMPESLRGGPLAEILPVTLNPQWSDPQIRQHTLTGFRPSAGVQAGMSTLTQLDPSADANSALWSEMPLWYWHSPYTQLKGREASAIWTIEEAPGPVNPAAAGLIRPAQELPKNALLATMNVGLGKSLYLASDQTWRLRQVGGQNIHERFWGQVLRWAVASDLPAGGKYVRFGSDRNIYSQDQSATITARILREDLSPYSGLTFSAIAKARPAPGASAGSAQTSVEARFVEIDGTPGYYTATIGGMPVGEVEISLQGTEVERLLDNDPSVTQKTLLISVVPHKDLEDQNKNTNPELLARVAQGGGGYSLDIQYADILFNNLPVTQHQETETIQLGFFTDPEADWTQRTHWLFLGLFAALITAEWIIRKRAGLV